MSDPHSIDVPQLSAARVRCPNHRCGQEVARYYLLGSGCWDCQAPYRIRDDEPPATAKPAPLASSANDRLICEQRYRAARATFDPDEEQVFAMVFDQGLQQREVARRKGRTESWVSKLLGGCRRKLLAQDLVLPRWAMRAGRKPGKFLELVTLRRTVHLPGTPTG